MDNIIVGSPKARREEKEREVTPKQLWLKRYMCMYNHK